MLNVVVDTNIVVGAYFRYEKDCLELLSKENDGQFNTVISSDMTEEMLAVVTNTYLLNNSINLSIRTRTNTFKKMIRLYRRALPIEPQNRLSLITKDISDNMFLECAVEGNADCIVTKNYHHFDDVKGKLKNNNGVTVNIYNPIEFNAILKAEQEVASGIEKNTDNKENNKDKGDIRE